MELSLRSTIEADVVDLQRRLDGLTLERHDLELQAEYLAEDLVLLKTNHAAVKFQLMNNSQFYFYNSMTNNISI